MGRVAVVRGRLGAAPLVVWLVRVLGSPPRETGLEWLLLDSEGGATAEWAARLGALGADHSRKPNCRVCRAFFRGAGCPASTTFALLLRLPEAVRGRTRWLCTGEFLEQATNVCVFGNPGVGKTHLMAAVGRALVERRQPVLFVAMQALVERLVEAKRDLRLARELRRMDRHACLCLDDIGYVRQDWAEMEALFTLLAERYERRSVMITSNLVFSQWNQIFHDDMTATKAIDRVVHHSVILELTVPSYRAEAARARTQGEER